jgi:uncharacterized protein HemX
MVVVAPPQAESAAARGATGWFVLIFLTIAAAVTIYFAYENWRPGGLAQQVQEQEDLAAQYQTLSDYMTRLDTQNQEMQQNQYRRYTPPPAPRPPALQREIEDLRADFTMQRDRNRARWCRGNSDRCTQWCAANRAECTSWCGRNPNELFCVRRASPARTTRR